MTKDFATLGAGYSYQLFQMPSFHDLEQFVTNSSFAEQLPLFVQSVFPGTTVKPEESFFDEYYASFINERIQQFDPNSFIYKYIALTHDFRIIKNAYLQAKAEGKDSYLQAVKENKLPSLFLFDSYSSQLEKEEKNLHAVENTAEFINILDRLYLMNICEFAGKENEYVKGIVSAKIEAYNVMSVLRLTQLGRTRERIMDVLIDRPEMYSLGKIRNLAFGDVVTEVGQLLGIPVENISVTEIETYLLHKEVRAVNHAMFFGVGEERVIQYFEKFRFFISNIKLALAAQALNMEPQKMQSRLINYDLT